ncbi:MAG: hypothetical protein ACTSQF_09545 [Candidatus Heimdallarchaeaceae archaeon]
MMNCPYCGFEKTKRKKEASFGTYTCPRCDYLFEVSFGKVILDLLLSVPFSSILYTPILLVINYFIGKATFNSEDSYLPFGVFLMFLLITTALLLLFVFYMISGRSSRIFIVKAQPDNSFISKVKRIHPLLKMIVYLLIASIFAAIFF